MIWKLSHIWLYVILNYDLHILIYDILICRSHTKRVLTKRMRLQKEIPAYKGSVRFLLSSDNRVEPANNSCGVTFQLIRCPYLTGMVPITGDKRKVYRQKRDELWLFDYMSKYMTIYVYLYEFPFSYVEHVFKLACKIQVLNLVTTHWVSELTPLTFIQISAHIQRQKFKSQDFSIKKSIESQGQSSNENHMCLPHSWVPFPTFCVEIMILY